jgi:hypothetical protein
MTETPYTYWLWVTNRETIYASELNEHKDEAWTCDEKTKTGDLILLYCNSKGRAVKGYQKSVFCYLMQATSDAYDGEDYPGWRENGWKWACNSRVLYDFRRRNPVTYQDLKRKDSDFQEWDAYKRRNFQGRSFEIPEKIWNQLDDMAMEKEPEYGGYQKYIELTSSNIELISNADLMALDAEEGITEKGRDWRSVTFYEHNPKLRSKAIEIHGTKCKACKFDFNEQYGKYGHGFIEVHHLIPASSHEEETRVDPRTEMTVVCSNCHRMIHRKRDKMLSLEELGKIIKAK